MFFEGIIFLYKKLDNLNFLKKFDFLHKSMKIHHLRSATFLIEMNEKGILIDPMLNRKSTFLGFAKFRNKNKLNPIVELPPNHKNILSMATHCILTHDRSDHLDKDGVDFLKTKKIPITCSFNDAKYLKSDGLNIQTIVKPWKFQNFFDGKITGIPGTRGYGWIKLFMSKVMGYYFKIPNFPSVYISSDTVFTADVEKALKEYKPDISVLACGCAQLDMGQPLLMNMDDIIKFVQMAPNKVYANHLEGVDECTITRKMLKEKLKENGLLGKVWIPEDGNTIHVK